MKDVEARSSALLQEIGKAVVGKQDMLENLIAAVLTGGHVLFEDFPGLAKTLSAQSLAMALGLEFRRIQFTPDLLPGDITGGYVYDRNEGSFVLRKGPLFTQVLLADEINRASPKTQSALLEAMQERQVTIEGETYPLPEPFLVIATQNPVEYEGTFPLPEAQLDRFTMRLSVGYPELDEERQILKRRRERQTDQIRLQPVLDGESLATLRQQVEEVFLDPDLEEYIVRIIRSTRSDQRIRVGASPRGSLALMRCAMARAAMKGRSYVLPDDIKHFIVPVLAHRIMLEPDYWMRSHAAEDIVQSLGGSIPVPVTQEISR